MNAFWGDMSVTDFPRGFVEKFFVVLEFINFIYYYGRMSYEEK